MTWSKCNAHNALFLVYLKGYKTSKLPFRVKTADVLVLNDCKWMVQNSFKYKLCKWVTSWQNPQNDVCPAKTKISLGIRPVWSESSLSAWWKLGPLATHWVHSEDWSDWGDAQADLSLHWAHMPFCCFCHEVAQMFLSVCLQPQSMF